MGDPRGILRDVTDSRLAIDSRDACVAGLVGWNSVGIVVWYPFFLAADGNLSGLVATPLIVLFTTLLSGMWSAYGVLLAALMRRFGSLPVPV